jgi:hypothetical protein
MISGIFITVRICSRTGGLTFDMRGLFFAGLHILNYSDFGLPKFLRLCFPFQPLCFRVGNSEIPAPCMPRTCRCLVLLLAHISVPQDSFGFAAFCETILPHLLTSACLTFIRFGTSVPTQDLASVLAAPILPY